MYSQIDSNKRKTWGLIIFFSIFTVLVVSLLVYSSGADVYTSLAIGGVFSVCYSLIAFYASDKVALQTQGAQKIHKEQAPDLYRLVENLCITAGLPMPAIYLIEDEAPNAFATGRDPEHASIAVTTGLLARLEKIELEGVLAHELGHIKNYDIRLMTIVVVLVGLLILVSDILIRMNIFGHRSKELKGGALVILLVGLLLGILSPLIAQVIKLAVSRTREYLADASGALLTRHPDGLASALTKIESYHGEMKRANHATAHLYISSPFGAKKKGGMSWYNRLFATHPPIADRIAKLRNMTRT